MAATDLLPALPFTKPPTWPAAVWVGDVDVARLGDGTARLLLADAAGYCRARLLVRNGQDLLGFVEVGVDHEQVDASEVRAAVSRLHLPPYSPATPPTRTDGLTVVVCTRDRVPMLKVALASILELDYAGLSVIVVDNAADTDETRRYVDELTDPRLRLVVEPRPGLSRARNAGLRAATTDIVAFTDDDVVVDRYWLQGIVAGFNRGCTVACVSGIVPSGELRTPAQAYFDQRVGWSSSCTPRVFHKDSPPADVPLFPFQVGIYGTGANFAVRRSVMFKLGGFDEALGVGAPTNGGEDLDMFFRVLDDGWQLAYEPSAVVWHRHRADNAALALQARGYGLGLGAWLTKIALNPRTMWFAIRTAVAQAPHFVRLSYRMSTVATPPVELSEHLPARIGLIELMSIFKGPLAYRGARREGRRATPLWGR
ncbi:glycosyltransferase [Mycobacterium yunnanensis]|uniref:Glycosyltransferase n=1 Tax=Mycobacterium yunnanensis TaxID=368477 RepID=A0A9X3C4N6_9MYCO|nr:glycosyltransferase [Mycobacterium yunnanensis]MCV7423757.1 glycosyltransferase [Mycobacterium yunnanensis]